MILQESEKAARDEEKNLSISVALAWVFSLSPHDVANPAHIVYTSLNLTVGGGGCGTRGIRERHDVYWRLRVK